MQLGTCSSRPLRSGWITSCLACLIVCGCDRGAADAASNGPATARASSTSSAAYDIVLATRPEQSAIYYKHIKPFYDLCAVAARELNVPVKPFLTLPADFVVERRRIVTDGKNRMDKTEGAGLGSSDLMLSPKGGCATDLGVSSVTQLTSNGKRQNISVSSEGSSDISPPETLVDAPARKSGDLGDYSVKKSVLGVSVRCLSATHPVISSQTLLEACIYDGTDGTTLLDDEGKAILIYSRQLSPVGNGGPANTLVTEPIKVSVGKAIDANLFKLQGAPK